MKSDNTIQSYISSFEQLLLGVDPAMLSEEIYCRKYFIHLRDNSRYYLSIYASVLEKLLQNSQLEKHRICLLDYGAGNGLLGIFACYCGFGCVALNDIDSQFLESARKLSQILRVEIDAFIAGDIQQIKEHPYANHLNAIAGTDVIEHIYNLDDFFAAIQSINPSTISVFTTASNPLNFFKVRKLRQLQRKDELEGGEPGDFLLFGSEPLQPYYQIRKAIILEILPGINPDELSILATHTRGLNLEDIKKAVDQYSFNKTLPVLMLDPYNTCNPLTGSWTERILPLQDYASLYKKNGFSLFIYHGFYNKYKKGLKGLVSNVLNRLIPIFKHRISPFIVFVGVKK